MSSFLFLLFIAATQFQEDLMGLAVSQLTACNARLSETRLVMANSSTENKNHGPGPHHAAPGPGKEKRLCVAPSRRLHNKETPLAEEF